MATIKFKVLEPVEIRGKKIYIAKEKDSNQRKFTYYGRYLGSEANQKYHKILRKKDIEFGHWTQVAFDETIDGEWWEEKASSKEEFVKWLRRQDIGTAFQKDNDVFEPGPHRDRIANGEFLFSDYDDDGVPNIDDKNPFDAGKPDEERINNEILLARELKRLGQTSRKHRKLYEEFKGDFQYQIDSGRVKQPESILRKLRKKHMDSITDIIGVTVLVEDKEKVKEVAQNIKKKHEVIKYKDYYKNPKQDFYRAIHVIIEYKGEEVEIQIKTPEQFKLHKKAHERYKQGKEPTSEMKDKAKRLANK
jgi:hypothetical protein